MQLKPHAILFVALLSWVPNGGCSPARSASDPSTSMAGNDSAHLSEGRAPQGSASSSRAETEAHPLIDGREPRPQAALPRLTYKHLGMHIGGESNSAESKRPWLEDIERGDDAILSCFRFVNDPEKAGSYGVDLYVGLAGGAPEVRGSRQKLGGEDFDQCMKEAFGAIDFHEPERPTVFSYSIYLELRQTDED